MAVFETKRTYEELEAELGLSMTKQFQPMDYFEGELKKLRSQLDGFDAEIKAKDALLAQIIEMIEKAANKKSK
eukprot:g20340.t1